jgi:type IV fimbrial biogenesis protein FimT
MRQRPAGFTLIETAAALAVVGILAGIALPSLQGAAESARAGEAKAALMESWLASVNHAAVTGSEVVLCPGDAGGCRASVDWTHGWIAFADLDGDRTRDPNETLLKSPGPLHGRVHLRSTPGRVRLVFQPNGGTAGSNVTWTLCDGRGPGDATTLVMANDGRLRSGTPGAAAAQACMQAM